MIMSGSLANPTFVPMLKDLGVTVQQASYTTTVFVLDTGLTPMALTPFANVYGRRDLVLGNVPRVWLLKILNDS